MFTRKYRAKGRYFSSMRAFWVSLWCKLATSLMLAHLMVRAISAVAKYYIFDSLSKISACVINCNCESTVRRFNDYRAIQHNEGSV